MGNGENPRDTWNCRWDEEPYDSKNSSVQRFGWRVRCFWGPAASGVDNEQTGEDALESAVRGYLLVCLE
jgi:hypothetical protein